MVAIEYVNIKRLVISLLTGQVERERKLERGRKVSGEGGTTEGREGVD